MTVLSREMALEMADRIEAMQHKAKNAAQKAREEAAGVMHTATIGATAAGIGAMEAYRGKTELVAGLSTDLAVAMAGLGFAMFGGAKGETKEIARSVGNGGLAVYAYKWGVKFGSDAAKKTSAPAQQTRGFIGAGAPADDDLMRLAALAAR